MRHERDSKSLDQDCMRFLIGFETMNICDETLSMENNPFKMPEFEINTMDLK